MRMFKKRRNYLPGIVSVMILILTATVSGVVSHYYLSYQKEQAVEEIRAKQEEYKSMFKETDKEETDVTLLGTENLYFIKNKEDFKKDLESYTRNKLGLQRVSTFAVLSISKQITMNLYQFFVQMDDSENTILNVYYNRKEDTFEYAVYEEIIENIETWGGVPKDSKITIKELYNLETEIQYVEVKGLDKADLTDKQSEKVEKEVQYYMYLQERDYNVATKEVVYTETKDESTDKLKILTFAKDGVTSKSFQLYYYLQEDVIIIL